jgi:uncharacterized protein (DUF2267 family)
MDYANFIATVEAEAGLTTPVAEQAACVTLGVLSERLSVGETRDIAERLPQELRSCLQHDGHHRQVFGADEFLRRIAEREHVEHVDAERQARAVFAALGRAVGPDEVADIASELPKDFEPLLAAAQQPTGPPLVMPAGEFVDHVARTTGLDPDHARRAVGAVLETLGERVSHGEVKDIAAQLDEPLRPPLLLGDRKSHGAARPMSLDEFVREVAEREGVTPDEALHHTRAVLGTLRQAVSEKEWRDMTAQLPDEYTVLLPRP